MARQDRCLRLLDKIDDNDIAGVKDVLQYDVDLTVDRKGDTPMHSAARKGSLEILKLLVEYGGNVNQKNINGYAPIHYAARDGRMDIVTYFIQHGADPNIQNKDGDAPIHELVKVQPMDVIEEMISLGMKIHLKNKMGRTPLHVATRNDRHEATEILLTCGADGKIKDKDGKTAEELCKSPELVNRMKLHDVMMEALRKGTVKAQGVTLSKRKKTMELKRVSVVLESFELPTNSPVSFYCRREKSENTTNTMPKDNGDEMVSDLFYLKISDVPRACHVTLTVPIYGVPKDSEDLFVRYENGNKEMVTKYTSTESGQEDTCTFTTELFPECFTTLALYTCAKTDEQIIGKEGAVISTPMDEELKIEIPPDTFDQETKLSIQVFTDNEFSNIKDEDCEETEENKVLLTDVYSIQADNYGGICENRNRMKLTLPIHGYIKQADDIVVLTLSKIDDKTNEECVEVIDSVVKLVGKTIVYEIPHFSIHVAAPKRAHSANLSEIYKRLVSATERQRTAVFFVVVREELTYTAPSVIVVVECCAAEKAEQRLKKWEKKGYTIQSPEMSGGFMLKPYTEFSTTFQGIKPADSSDKRKIAFLPRRPSYQPYRITEDDLNTKASDNESTPNEEGDVIINVINTDHPDKNKEEDGRRLTVLPFRIKVKPLPEKQEVTTFVKEPKKPPQFLYPKDHSGI